MARFANFQPRKASRQGETWLFTNRLCRSYVLVETSSSQPVRPDAMAARGSKSVKDPLCCRSKPLFGRRTSALSEAEAPNTVPSMARACRSDLKGFAWRPRGRTRKTQEFKRKECKLNFDITQSTFASVFLLLKMVSSLAPSPCCSFRGALCSNRRRDVLGPHFEA